MDKDHLLKILQTEIETQENNKSIFVVINVAQIIDRKDSQHISLKRKVIKELHNIVFDESEERLFYGKRIDFGTTDLVDKHKNRLGRLRFFFAIFLVVMITMSISFIIYAIVNKQYDMMSAPTILTLAFTHIWNNYYNEQRLCQPIKYDILKTNYEYDNHLQLILRRLIDRKIVFIFKQLDELEQQQISDVLNEIRFFSGHINVKTIISLNEIKLFKSLDKTWTVNDQNNQKNLLRNYFDYTLRIEQLCFDEALLFFNECYLSVSKLFNDNWTKKLDLSRITNVIKKDTIFHIILATENLSMQQIVRDLNSFIVLSLIQSENQIYYEELIATLIISCFKSRFINIFLALLKDSTQLIWKKIIKIVKNHEDKDLLEILSNVKNKPENWILKISDVGNCSNNEIDSKLALVFEALGIEITVFNDFKFIKFLFAIKNYLVIVANENFIYKKKINLEESTWL